MSRIDTTNLQLLQGQAQHAKQKSKLYGAIILAVLLSLALGGLTNMWHTTQPSAKAAQVTRCNLRNASYTVRQLDFPDDNLNNGWAPDSQHIAYADLTDGRIKVYDVRANTTVATLTPSMYAAAPQWSADGRRIYFSARADGTSSGTGPQSELTLHTPPDLYIMNANGSDMRKVTIDSPMPSGSSVVYWDSTTPAKFSPDGAHVAFSTLQGVTSPDRSGMANAAWIVLIGDLTTINRTPHLVNIHPLTPPSPLWREAKGFTRDSKKLLLGTDTHDGQDSSPINPDVYTLDLSTQALTRYTSNPAWEETMDVNPVSNFIIFNSDRANPLPPNIFTGGHHDLYLAGLQGDADWTRRLTTDGDPDNGGWASQKPRWSPNGLKILFQERDQLTASHTMLLTFTCTAAS